MSIVIGYFFNYDKSLAELKADINSCLGCHLAPYEGNADDLYARFLTMEFSLCEDHGLVNDAGIDFEAYRFELSFRTPLPNALARPIQLPAISLVVYSLFLRLRITGILVHEVQTLLARYEERESNLFSHYDQRDIDLFADGDMTKWLYDTLSDEPVTNYRRHPQHLEERLNRD